MLVYLYVQIDKNRSPWALLTPQLFQSQIMRDAQFSRPVFGTVNRHSRSNDEQRCRGPTEPWPKNEIRLKINTPVTVVMQGCTGTRQTGISMRYRHFVQDTESHGLIKIIHVYGRHGPGLVLVQH